MKKILFILVLVILLTGCSKNKKLDCTKTINDEVSSIEYKNTITFNDSKISKSTNKMTLTFKSDIENNMNNFTEYGSSAMEQYKKQEGVDATMDKTSNSIVLIVNYDISKMNDNNINNNKFNYDYNKLKEEYISSGYTCK